MAYHHQQSSVDNEQQHQLGAGSPYSSFPQYGSLVDPAFLSPVIHRTPSRQSPHLRQASNEWHQQQQQQQRQPSSSLSPRLSHANTTRGVSSPFIPTDRTLPTRNVDANTITDAYVGFILYCNPSFDLSVNTTTLRENFQSLPKSDNKDFEIYRLFELIKKFDAKEIKTWGQLALDLGVEPPDVSKGQSVQKVQQYSVRLKRWMRAMHVDAFFEYLLGKQHAYSQEVPPLDDPYPASGRDGVVAEEDLAIRALDPSFRPKRGRRRNSEAEHEEEAEPSPGNIQTRFASDFPSSTGPLPILPFTSHPEGAANPWAIASAVTPHTFAPWMQRANAPQSAIATSAPSHLRWQLHDPSQNLATPHPMTALPGSMAAHIDAAFDNEPKSAITPSTRKRRKHGPAVSSAWSSASAQGAKPRGRPPSNRNVQDGPFTTFPVDPANDKTSAFAQAPPSAHPDRQPAGEDQSGPSMRPALTQRPSDPLGRPGRLSLQVPPHTGGPVRLATPPRVTVTGDPSESDASGVDIEQQEANLQPPPSRVLQHTEEDIPGFAFEVLKRVLASDLLRAELVGRRRRLNGDEAKRLAVAILTNMNVPRMDTNSSSDDIARLTAASWLGVGDQLNVPLGPASSKGKRIKVTRLRVDADGVEELVSALDNTADVSRETYDIAWSVTVGRCKGNFELKGLSLPEPEPEVTTDAHDQVLDTFLQTARRVGLDDERTGRLRQGLGTSMANRRANRVADDGVDWEEKYRALEFGSKMAKGEFDRFRDRLIERVLDILM